jgi:hypothetical protein
MSSPSASPSAWSVWLVGYFIALDLLAGQLVAPGEQVLDVQPKDRFRACC